MGSHSPNLLISASSPGGSLVGWEMLGTTNPPHGRVLLRPVPPSVLLLSIPVG